MGLDDTRSANRILNVIGCDGTLQLHFPSAKSPLRYLVDSQTLVSMSKMRNVIPNRNITTWFNTDARLTPKTVYEPGINRKIAIRELGVVAFNDFIGHLCQVGQLKREEGPQEAITELQCLMRGRNFGRNSSGNLRISGSSGDRILKNAYLWQK